MTDVKPKHRFWQFSLSTALVFVLISAFFLWLNLRKEEPGWPIPFYDSEILYKASPDPTRMGDWHVEFGEKGIDAKFLAFDVIVAFTISIFVAATFERSLHRETRKP